MLVGAPDQWTQLLGNHEAGYVGGPTFWREEIRQDSVAVLRRWIKKAQVSLAVALETTELGPVLVTHAGLTRQKWETIGMPGTARETAAAINAELVDDPDAAFRAGEMIGALTDGPVGVVWASPAELLSSWDGHQLPFSQVYGHASPVVWKQQTWDLRLARRYTERGSVDSASRRVEFEWPLSLRGVSIRLERDSLADSGRDSLVTDGATPDWPPARAERLAATDNRHRAGGM